MAVCPREVNGTFQDLQRKKQYLLICPCCANKPPFIPHLHGCLVHIVTSFYPETHLIHEETETQRGKVTCSRGPNCDVREQGLLYSKTLIILVNHWRDIRDEKTVEEPQGKVVVVT